MSIYDAQKIPDRNKNINFSYHSGLSKNQDNEIFPLYMYFKVITFLKYEYRYIVNANNPASTQRNRNVVFRFWFG